MRSVRSGKSAVLGPWFATLCLVTLLLLSAHANAQIAGTGNVQGAVEDASGAVIQNAAVTITDVATQVKHFTRSDNAGLYVFPGLPVGTYTLNAVSYTHLDVYKRQPPPCAHASIAA